MSPTTKQIPSSVLIVGSGVFGLSTAYSLTQHPSFTSTQITLIDRLPFPAADGSSIDTSRIVRADYADIAYSSLAFEAQEKWRNEWWGANDIYHEPGLAVVVNAGASAGDNGELGREYMRKSMDNVIKLGLKPGKKSEGGEVEALDTSRDIRRIFNDGSEKVDQRARSEEHTTGSPAGDFGYVNWRSGWADAEKGMRALREKVEATNRVTFVHGTVKRLHFTATSVSGVEIGIPSSSSSSSEETKTLTADLVILATGAWTPSLIDTRGICSATGQILTYLPITSSEQAALGSNPTLLNESSGLFIIPPQKNLLKVARHGYGYSNPTTIAHPELPLSSGEKITVSLPRTHVTTPGLEIPEEGLRACRNFLAQVLPALSTPSRPFTATRICWYTDTPKGDWLVSYHPRYENLFVATGGSGHAYKFLPVVGDKVVECVLGDTPEAFKGKWEWKEGMRVAEDQVWTEDWRGGVKGMVLDEEYKKGEKIRQKL